MSKINSFLNTTTINTGEEDEAEQFEGYRPIAELIEEIGHSKIVMYLSYTGGLRLQIAVSKYNEALAAQQDRLEDPSPNDPEVELINPEDALSDDEKALIYAAYLIS